MTMTAQMETVEALGVFGRVRANEPMSRHTSFRVGGPADYLVTPASANGVPGLLATAHALGIPVTVLGNGSNLVVRDGGIAGIVLRLSECTAITRIGDTSLMAEGGAGFPRLAREAARWGLAGVEFAVGIPGTIGGAVVMNAGAHGDELSQVLECVDIATADGDVITLTMDRLRFGYRSSQIPRGVVVGAVFELEPGDPAKIHHATRENLHRRRRTQPILTPNAGSFFKNPPGHQAGRLIEDAGCKGWEVGDAQVSELHANFLVNQGKATATDIVALSQRVMDRVARVYGIELEREVRIVGREVGG